MPFRVSEEEFARLVDEALASLPPEFQPYMENVSVEVRTQPDREMRESLNLEEDTLLLGLYQGVPLTKKSVTAPIEWPERVLIFQRSVEQVCGNREEIVAQVRRTVLHEVGHHFGLSEADLRKLGYG